MRYYASPKQSPPTYREGSYSFDLLKEENGCVAGCCAGITVYTADAYPAAGVHVDQEGFIVLQGTGWARVGEEEFRIEPEISFVAPAGIRHCIKKDPDSPPVKVFWFHAAI